METMMNSMEMISLLKGRNPEELVMSMIKNNNINDPTINELIRPLINALELKSFSYHLKVNPFHIVPDAASLNEKIININNGMYKNKYTRII